MSQPPHPEMFLPQLKSFALFPHQVRNRNFTIVKDDLIRPFAHHGFEPAGDLKSGCALIDQKAGNPAVGAFAGIGHRQDLEKIRIGMSDKALTPLIM